MPEFIPICVQPCGYRIFAETTATPGLVVFQNTFVNHRLPFNAWQIATAKDGCLVAWAMTRNSARLVAGALGGLPVNWKRLRFRTQSDVEEFTRQASNALPADLVRWMRDLRKDGAQG